MNLAAGNHFYQYQNPVHQLKLFEAETVSKIARKVFPYGQKGTNVIPFEMTIIAIGLSLHMPDRLVFCYSPIRSGAVIIRNLKQFVAGVP